ncbi:uncharacterized protein BJX67DRAFT_241493 [Aspergillus lucknowensis]|uniref:DUF7730 domain-containing protein n=1 Tax=Aspergillus lucknowensis TaxID=176173 RepID=A0ABR4LGV4_9EURO
MERKRLKTHHPDSDAVSFCSTDSNTLSLESSDMESLPIRNHFSIPGRSSLLSLPREIRFLIYQYAFSSSSHWDELIRITAERNPSACRPQTLYYKPSPKIKLIYNRKPALYIPVALLRTCHQIYHEALPVLFSGVSFGFATNPTSLTFLIDRFSDTARRSIRYLHLYPAPLYVSDGPTGIRLSWAVMCAQVARLPSLRRVGVMYDCVEDLKMNPVEFHRSRYGKSMARIKVRVELEFKGQDLAATEFEECHRRLMEIMHPAG